MHVPSSPLTRSPPLQLLFHSYLSFITATLSLIHHTEPWPSTLHAPVSQPPLSQPSLLSLVSPVSHPITVLTPPLTQPAKRAPRRPYLGPVGLAPTKFPKFGQLPPEIQLIVWEHALANCYLERQYIGGPFSPEYEWSCLTLACRTSWRVAQKGLLSE